MYGLEKKRIKSEYYYEGFIMKCKLIFAVITVFTLSLPYLCSETAYKPEIGDNVIMVYNVLKCKSLEEARDFFIHKFIMKFKDPLIFKNTLYLGNTAENEIIIITFCKPANNIEADLSDDFFSKDKKVQLIANTVVVSFRLLTLNNENFVPGTGDYAAIWEYNYKAKSIASAVKSFNDKAYPLLKDYKNTRNSYLLYQNKLNVYAGISLFRGSPDDFEVFSNKIKQLDKFFWRNSAMKIYKILKVD
jgi:hypothetical protein